MKTFTKIFIAILFLSQSVFAQSFPETFNYQAVARNNDGSPIASTQITVEVSIIQGNNCETNPGACNLIWQELHFPTTNDFGLFSINIGNGQNTFAGSAGAFNTINWNDFSSGNYFVQLRVDFGNSSYANGLIDMGTVELQAVPYSTTAKTAQSLVKTSGKVDVNISDLQDVTLTALSNNQVLLWNGTKWVNSNPAASVILAFDDLSDVVIAAPATNQTVLYNGTNWVNSTFLLNTISNVSAAAPSNGDLLQFNGTNWINNTIALNNLSDATIAGAATNQILKYNGTNWINSDLAITNLSGVSITSPSNGQALVYNGTNWINQSVGSSWTNDGSYLFYNGALNVGIGTSTPSERFHLATTGNQGILITGTYNAAGSVPDLGAGTRMTFYPVFAAFRAGTVTGTQWNSINMGKYSAAFGNNNTANGQYSAAFGNTNKSGGVASLSCGTTNIAFGANSFVCGINNNVTVIAGADNSIVGGSSNNSQSSNSLTVGTSNSNNYSNSILFGQTCKINAIGSIAGGNNCNAAADYSAVFGLGNTTYSFGALVIGQYNYDLGTYHSTSWIATEPIFIVGNGTGPLAKNNALVIYKNGNIATEGVLAQSQTNPSKSALISNFTDILKLNAYSNLNKGNLIFGFSASEVEKYFPSLVLDFNNTKAISYTQFIPLIVETIKTQQNTIDQLQTENADLKKKLDDIDKRLQILENK